MDIYKPRGGDGFRCRIIGQRGRSGERLLFISEPNSKTAIQTSEYDSAEWRKKASEPYETALREAMKNNSRK